jgi:pentose-5-phosphate-3-epimerase
MNIICPTITAGNLHTYREQMERVEPFASRIHIDLMDGEFTNNKSIEIDQVWLPEDMPCDIHLMFQNPERVINDLINIHPQLVIIQAESTCNFIQFANDLHNEGIKAGISVRANSDIASVADYLKSYDHLLIFSGNLGYQGGSTADLSLLNKAEEAKRINSALEIGWDGGVNNINIAQIASGGVDVINVGGFIQSNLEPSKAFHELEKLLSNI